MANIEENTSYNTEGASQKPLANLSNTAKTVSEPADTRSIFMPHYKPEAFDKLFGKSAPVATDWATPVNKPLYETSSSNTQPIPSDYTQFVPADKNGKWVNPTDTAEFRNWPTALGGGQYVIDPSQKGQLIKSARTIMENDINPGAKQAILGKKSPSLYQVDHIVPLWLGGADTLQNLQVLDNITHQEKTAVQAVALTLLANNKIDLNDAKVMALTWKDKDPKGITVDDKGYVDLKTAEKVSEKWKNDVSNPSMWKFFGESFKENMSNFGKDIPVLGEFAKGLVAGGTANMLEGTGPREESGKVGAVSNFAGNLVGTITGLGLLSKGIGSLKVAAGLGKATALSADAMKAAGLATDYGALTAKGAASSARGTILKKMASSAGLLGLWGQIGTTGREAINKDVDFEMKNHMTQFFTDVAFGGLLGAAGQNVKGYATVGLGSTVFSLFEQSASGHDPDIVSALQDGAIMTALHGMGYKRGMIDPKKMAGNEEAYKMSASTMNDYVGDIMPTVKKGQKVPEILRLDLPKVDQMRVEMQQKYPYDQRFSNMPAITSNAEAVNFIEQAAKRELGNTISRSNGTIPIEDIKKEMTRITLAKNQLANQTLPPSERVQKEWKDLLSMGEKLRPNLNSNNLRGSIDATKMLEKVPADMPNVIYGNPSGKKFPTGNMPSTGYEDKVDVKSKGTITDLYDKPNDFSEKLFIVKDPETAKIMRIIAHEQSLDPKRYPKGPTVGNPDEALRIFAMAKTPNGTEIRPAGFVPREQSYTKENNLNKTYSQITDRLKNIIKKSESADDLFAKLSKDRSKVNITKEEAIKIFASKDTAMSMNGEEIRKLLKTSDAFEKYDQGLNNSEISKAMDENDLNVLVVSKDKVLPVGDAVNRANPDNPYLSLNLNEQDWLRSIALKEGSVRKTNIDTGIDNIVNKQRSENISKGVGNAKTLISENPTQAQLPMVEKPALNTPVSEAKMTVEAPKTVGMDNVTEKKNTGPIKEEKAPELNAKGEPETIVNEKLFEKFEPSKPINSSDVRSEIDGINRAAVKAVDKKIKTLDLNTKEAEELQKFKEMFTRKNMETVAIDSLEKASMDEMKGAELYIDRISKAFTGKGLEDPTKGQKNKQAYKKLFRDSILNKESTVFKVGEDGKMSIEIAKGKKPKSYLERTLQKDTVYYEENNNTKLPDEASKINFLVDNGYAPYYYDNKPGSLMGIKYDPALAGGKNIKEKGALNEFTTNIAEQLGIKKGEDSINTFAKRLKSLNSREQQSPIKGETFKTYIIKDETGFNKTVAETTPNWDNIKVHPSVKNPELVKKELGEKMHNDGSQYSSQKLINRHAEGIGMEYAPEFIKPTQSFKAENGQGFHQKLEWRAWTEGEKAKFEKELGVKLGDSDIVTFPGNVKIGYEKVGKDMGGYWVVDSPSESFSIKYKEPHEMAGTISIGSILTKISPESGLGEIMGKHYVDYAKKLKTLSEELQGATSSFDIEKIWKKYPEFNKDEWMNNLFGDLKASAEHGAGLVEFGKTINKEINKLVTEDYLGGKFMKGDNLHIKPDMEVKLDPKTGKKTYMDSGEIMISKDVFEELYGKEALKEAMSGKTFEVLAFRYPTLKDTSVAKMKVLIAEMHGEKLGKTQVITNSADTMKFDHDTDGDTLQMFAIGGKDGVPNKVANYFKANAAEGEMIFPNLNKTAKIPFDGEKTFDKLMEYSKQSLKGGKAIGIAASSARPMRFLRANKYEMRVSAPEGNSRTIEHTLNGTVFETEKVPVKAKDGSNNFEKSPKGEFVVKPVFGDEQSYLIGQIGQEAVDSVGTTDLINRFKGHNGDASKYITEQLYSNASDDIIKKELRKFTSEFQVPFKFTNDSADSIQKLAPYIEKIKKVKEDGGTLGPVEEIVLNLDGIKKIDHYFKNDVAQRGIDSAGREQVNKDFRYEAFKPASPTLLKWKEIVVSVANDTGIDFNKKKKALKTEWNKFKKEHKIGEEEKKEIAIWAALSPNSNLGYGKIMARPSFLINESPEVAKSYFQGETLYNNIKGAISDGQSSQ